ncbi:MAG: hypothetical protein R3E04_00070 [Sphingobium sp.]
MLDLSGGTFLARLVIPRVLNSGDHQRKIQRPVQVQIRRKGWPFQSGTFRTRKEAQAWARKTESEMIAACSSIRQQRARRRWPISFRPISKA